MNNVIHIFGGSGSGTTTLGRAMKDAYGFEHLDVDDYYWLPTKLPFTEKRGVRERQDLLRGDIEAAGNCVISGSLCGWGGYLYSLLFAGCIYGNTCGSADGTTS